MSPALFHLWKSGFISSKLYDASCFHTFVFNHREKLAETMNIKSQWLHDSRAYWIIICNSGAFSSTAESRKWAIGNIRSDISHSKTFLMKDV